MAFFNRIKKSLFLTFILTALMTLSVNAYDVKGGEVKVVATTFEFAEDIDLERAEAAKARAEAAIEAAEKAAKDEKTILIAKAKLKRALTRISVAKYK